MYTNANNAHHANNSNMSFAALAAAPTTATSFESNNHNNTAAAEFPAPEPRPSREMSSMETETIIDSNNNENDVATDAPNKEDPEMMRLMAEVNDQLEAALTENKKVTKRVFKELMEFQKVATEVYDVWEPLKIAEHEEAARLDELQNEVNGATNVMPSRH